MKLKNQNGQRDGFEREAPGSLGESGKKKGRSRGKDEEKLVTVSFAAEPTRVAEWKAKAKADRRPLSAWLYLRLLAADARDEESVARVAVNFGAHGAI